MAQLTLECVLDLKHLVRKGRRKRPATLGHLNLQVARVRIQQVQTQHLQRDGSIDVSMLTDPIQPASAESSKFTSAAAHVCAGAKRGLFTSSLEPSTGLVDMIAVMAAGEGDAQQQDGIMLPCFAC
jgi:hypothetical protein